MPTPTHLRLPFASDPETHYAPSRRRRPRRRAPGSSRRWSRPSLGEFIARLDEAYGLSDQRRQVAVAMGLSGSDELSPSGLREFCVQLGVPPEDFGLDPGAE